MIGLPRKDGIELLFADWDRRPINSWEQMTTRDE